MRGRIAAGVAAALVVALGLWALLAGDDERVEAPDAAAPTALTTRAVDPAAAVAIDEAPFLVIPTELVALLADGRTSTPSVPPRPTCRSKSSATYRRSASCSWRCRPISARH